MEAMQAAVPHIEVTWQVAGVLVLIVGAATGGMAKFVSSAITSALLAFQIRLIADLNGTYVRSGLCVALMAEKARAAEIAAAEAARVAIAEAVERRLENLEDHRQRSPHNED